MARSISILLCLVLFISLPAHLMADEGMWLLDQVSKLPLAKFAKNGFALNAADIYSPDKISLTQAIVRLPGGTGSFISAEGLIITNHHVAYQAIQRLSTVEHDYLKDGFLAKSRTDELPVPNYSARVLISMSDVTGDVLSAVTDSMSSEQRKKAIDAKISDLQKAARGTGDDEYTISEIYHGIAYKMYGYAVYKDVRLVYAPPGSIGNFGGETDNWMWPRHTGDFSILRAYADSAGKTAEYTVTNVPVRSKKFLTISTKGIKEHDFAMAMGYPGRTFRYRTSDEITLQKDESLPLTVKLYKLRMDAIDAVGKNDRAVEIKYASTWRGMANTYKNYLGTLEGMKRSHVLEERKALEAAMTSFLTSHPDIAARHGDVLGKIRDLQSTLREFNRKQIVAGQISTGINLMRLASRFNSYAASFTADSTGKRSPSRPSAEVSNFITATFQSLSLDVDRNTMSSLLAAAAELPAGQRIDAFSSVLDGKSGNELETSISQYVTTLYSATALSNADSARALLEKGESVILADPFVALSVAFEKENLVMQNRLTVYTASIGDARRNLLAVFLAMNGSKAIYPDANSTMRLTFGTVKPYIPRDAVLYKFQTTLTGVIEKESTEDDFIVPERLHQLWAAKDFGNYVDPVLHDVPVAFLANLDITGGNSGSPVLNGKGELIGLAFDGNWEAVVGDYYYQEPLNRSINVDSRYVLFILDKYAGAQHLLNEMKLH